MADTKISALTVGTAASTDRWPIAISPFAAGDNRYLTHDLLGTYFAKNTLAAGTLTTSQPHAITQTWNAGGVTFNALLVNATITAASSLSNLINLQADGSTLFGVSRFGVTYANVYQAGLSLAEPTIKLFNGDVNIQATGGLNFWSGSPGGGEVGSAADVILRRDAAGVLAQRNGANAQTFRLYETYTDGSNYSRFSIGYSSGYWNLFPSGAGTGPGNRSIKIGADGTGGGIELISGGGFGISFTEGGSNRWSVAGATGHFLAGTDNTYDIGAGGANRPRNIYLGGSVFSIGDLQAGPTQYIYWQNSTTFHNRSDGVLTLSNFAENDFSRLQFGGTTSSFPAIKRNGAGLELVLADNSGQTNLTLNAVFANTVVSQETWVGGAGGPHISSGSGSPEGVVTAPAGSLYLNTAGGTDTTLYTKNSGSGNTGWVAVDNV